ncbi:hypothetical protein V6N13_132799 [Hibiscus sabdariffa]
MNQNPRFSPLNLSLSTLKLPALAPVLLYPILTPPRMMISSTSLPNSQVSVRFLGALTYGSSPLLSPNIISRAGGFSDKYMASCPARLPHMPLLSQAYAPALLLFFDVLIFHQFYVKHFGGPFASRNC